MRIRTKILLAFVSGLLMAAGAFSYWVGDYLRQGYRENVEEMMVDLSQLVAGWVESGGGIRSLTTLQGAFERYKSREFEGRIYALKKNRPALGVYVTDARGIVVYSSENPSDVGKDFSKWNDVKRTLDGGYGARSTRLVPSDENSSRYFVAAPVVRDGKLEGVVSVMKDRSLVAQIVRTTLRRAAGLGTFVAFFTLGFGILLFVWITRPLETLQTYARSVAEGKRVALPELSGYEVRQVGVALEEMRQALEGKKTIERFTQALTHEVKSPLTAIKGAAELSLEPDMSRERREKFLRNVLREADHAQKILEALLEVAALEAKSALDRTERVPLLLLVERARDGLLGMSEPRKIAVRLEVDSTLGVSCDPFLLGQAIRNVLQNAIEFSADEGVIEIRAQKDSNGAIRLSIQDAGPGIPRFAQERLFEKFFSLERPATGRKGTGLGLSFVREVLELHGGQVSVESPVSDGRGTRLTLALKQE